MATRNHAYRYVFGPVPSRRFGRSLGIDLTPHKTCCLDCVFCQLGRTRQPTLDRKNYVPTDDVIAEVGHWLQTDGKADYLTLSGSGEPSLHASFGDVLTFLHRQPVPSVLLTNGTLLSLPKVRASAALAHVVKASLSAWDQKSFEWVNRPHRDLHFETIVDGLKRFRNDYDGQLWIEVFLLAGINAMPGDVEKIARLCCQIKPDRIHLNTIVRPPAEDFAAAVPMAQLETLAGLFEPKALIAADFNGRPTTNNMISGRADILAMLQRRPCTIEQIRVVSGLHINEVSKILGQLMHNELIRADLRNRNVYYTCR